MQCLIQQQCLIQPEPVLDSRWLQLHHGQRSWDARWRRPRKGRKFVPKPFLCWPSFPEVTAKEPRCIYFGAGHPFTRNWRGTTCVTKTMSCSYCICSVPRQGFFSPHLTWGGGRWTRRMATPSCLQIKFAAASHYSSLSSLCSVLHLAAGNLYWQNQALVLEQSLFCR